MFVLALIPKNKQVLYKLFDGMVSGEIPGQR
jgi:hypothetical protein